MQASEKMEFAEIIARLYERYKRPQPSVGLVGEWFDDFADWTLEQFKWALAQHRKTSEFMPEPKNLFAIRDQAEGVLSAQEAWNVALASLDEEMTVVVNQEILEALGAAKEILATGSPSLAADAFKTAYKRIMDTRPPGRQKWTVSLGHNIEGRDDVVRDAVQNKLISQQQGAKLLTQSAPDVMGLLENKIPAGDQREKLKELRKALEDSQGYTDKHREERIAEAQRRLDDFEASRRESMRRLEVAALRIENNKEQQ